MNKVNCSTFRLVQYWYNDFDLERNLEFINGNRYNAGSSHHFAWKFHGEEMDAHGIEEREIVCCKRRVLWELRNADQIRTFCKSALTHGGWNDLFDRTHARECFKRNAGLILEV